MTVEHDAADGYDVGRSSYGGGSGYDGSGHRGGSGYDGRSGYSGGSGYDPPERGVPERGRSLIDERSRRCPRCVAVLYDDDRYCQACGFPLGEPVTSGDYNHREKDLAAVAGVCDRGVRHTTNEDAMGVAVVYGTMIAVVCDGVSTTPGSGQASAAAAATATAVLADAIRAHGPGRPVPVGRGRGGRSPSDDMLDILEPTDEYDDEAVTVPSALVGGFGPEDAELALHHAVHAAQETIAQLSAAEGRMAPSCTIAAAIISPPTVDGPSMVTVGWVGDSRVYLLGPRWSERLTADDTWAAEAARAGLIPASEAETHRRAHTLTRWLGGDAEDVSPHTAVFPIEGPATVLVCSDGLWNYASRPDVMAAIVNQLPPEAEAVEVARHLVDFAVDQGGHDNITVVAARVDR
ncbi:protein phosphatase 2C domain-containing protein [Frankia sp. CNm7]|uniref:Protein phosphatase 2C domain-containing protein n=1 Tax=Frankia nepalensis TaxID=1836974 RepID=A0A937UPX3_9ACTN|nr:PP2C family serine/threonine-protein phosphatase [Frankia nepalensis]MBL7499069.1 protein phosphatase 2C domain-containing protein [Frankia nepalensis]MBL7515682.1 protein phosphatase 2C domain-containing protein [Frankia nepalensis]MBL7519017.1 protein phosphatase 2C domain-containing protein [Frankia nepalensis]MBL7629518.1 protein phosphatase 2C domain-containing protein [Frankia nepalensis]